MGLSPTCAPRCSVASTGRLRCHIRERLEQQIDALVAEFLGEGRRAGLGYRQLDPEDEHAQKDARIFRAAGFTGPTRLEVPGWVVDRDADEVVASVFSMSYAAPPLFGDRVGQFEVKLRTVLTQASPTGQFSEEMRAIAVDLWHR